VDGDRKVAVVRESIEHNKILLFMNSRWRRHQYVLDITVTPSANLSLLRLSYMRLCLCFCELRVDQAAVVVILSD
jgi:hypothetical protein